MSFAAPVSTPLPGPQGELTSPPAAYAATRIDSLDIGGSVSSSILAAGLDPVDGVLLNGNDQLLATSAIRFARIRGSMSADSRILAATLPPTVQVGGATVAPATDPRFRL